MKNTKFSLKEVKGPVVACLQCHGCNSAPAKSANKKTVEIRKAISFV